MYVDFSFRNYKTLMFCNYIYIYILLSNSTIKPQTQHINQTQETAFFSTTILTKHLIFEKKIFLFNYIINKIKF
jgi:hypothetical protein